MLIVVSLEMIFYIYFLELPRNLWYTDMLLSSEGVFGKNIVYKLPFLNKSEDLGRQFPNYKSPGDS